MSTEKSFPIYRFASLRSPAQMEAAGEAPEIMPTTSLIDTLVIANEGEMTNAEKLSAYNTELQTYVDGEFFIKSMAEFNALKADNPDASDTYVNQLYDNVIVRTLTKSTSNKVYKAIVEELKTAYADLNGLTEEVPEVVIPGGIVPSFTEFNSPDPAEIPDDSAERTAILTRLQSLAEADRLLGEARQANVVSFESAGTVKVQNTEQSNIISVLGSGEVAVSDAHSMVDAKLSTIEEHTTGAKSFNQDFDSLGTVESNVSRESDASSVGVREVREKFDNIKTQLTNLEAAGVRTLVESETLSTDKYDPILTALGVERVSMDDAEEMLRNAMKVTGSKIGKVTADQQFSYVGAQWVETTDFQLNDLEDAAANELMPVDSGCELKFPFRIADLRVVEQQSVGYLPGEIAHINNTQPGEKNTRVTRRLKKVESTESLLTEEEVFRETDTQSTEKFSLETEASRVQQRDNEFGVSTSASANFGAYSVSIDAGYSTSNSTTQSNSSSQSQAKEIVQNIVDRVSNLVRRERSTKTVEEFEETVTHEIDNTGQGTKSYVYRWLDKLVRAKLKNYGKRLIFQFDVAHPAHYYLSRAIKDLPSITLPADPREVSVDGQNVLSIDNITRDNYLAWGAIYQTELDQPPAEKIIVPAAFSGTEHTILDKMIQIKEGYQCRKARVTTAINNGWPFHNYVILIIGNAAYGNWNGGADLWTPFDMWLNKETEQLPVSLLTGSQGFGINVEVECTLTDQAYMAWKIKTYNAIVEAYERLKADADSKLASFDPNLPGLHPLKKQELIKQEMKKEVIRKMFRCNPFWINDSFVVGQEYDPNCCIDNLNAERVRFLEKTFDWDNMTYELHPYFYSNKNSWAKLLDLEDNDPHFETFLQSSFATIQVPVHREHAKEVAAINFVKYNSIYNYEVIPQDEQAILEELDEVQPTLFTYDLEGNELPTPSEIVDLGIFNLPTSLVILECGTSDGVKPIGFPESTDDPTSDVVIPKQYSPAIIADSCPA